MSFYSRRSFSARYNGMLIRSTLEYLLIKAYENLDISYIYEPIMLTTPSGKKYKPDFYLPATREYIEVKPRKYIQETDKFSGLKIRIIFEDEVYQLVDQAGLDRYTLSKEWRSNAEIGPYGSITFTELVCPCGKHFKVSTASNRKRRFCSQTCDAIQQHRIEQSKLGAEKEKANQQHIYNNIKTIVDEYAVNNSTLIISTPLNKLGRLPIWKLLFDQTGIKDMRIYSKAIFGKDLGRKELLRYMKNISENICRTNENEQSLELEDKKPLG